MDHETNYAALIASLERVIQYRDERIQELEAELKALRAEIEGLYYAVIVEP